MLAAMFASDGGGDGGRRLDDVLSGIGEAWLEGGAVNWEAPSDLDPAYRDFLSRSVEALNSRLAEGALVIDERGTITPSGDSWLSAGREPTSQHGPERERGQWHR